MTNEARRIRCRPSWRLVVEAGHGAGRGRFL